MKEQLISFETAKLAKEKGFNEGCLNAYFIENGALLDIEQNNDYLFVNMSMSDEVSGFISVPTQSLLQKWLREEYNIDLWFDIIGNNQYHIEDIIRNGVIIGSCDDGHDSYEDALEAGLQEALKLIN